MLKNPSFLLNSKKRNLKFHFDMMHGDGNLDKAIKLLDAKDRSDFNDFVIQKFLSTSQYVYMQIIINVR